ncbi:carboxypeptidase-like regulatory domain-containing protein [Marinigracilibium pacificum]|uniref:Carboxypeptidase-like protein n=1 Tax=Marinigracilibium pacificum TaxID=2729599 RepID=A0A848IX65_9BACT|nr:carboxypeptidase-like regulatory domain-containing protein [Marinigracilibium pacificum]NMM47758.1 hypothetical protein [Marinigracilibium pacificum]
MKLTTLLKVSLYTALFFLCLTIKAQSSDSIVLKGSIIDKEGNPIPAALILQSGTSNGTITNENGRFELQIPKGSDLTISATGMKNIDIENINFSNVIINLSDNSIEFCCTNHTTSHCAVTMKELEKLSEKHNCTFK